MTSALEVYSDSESGWTAYLDTSSDSWVFPVHHPNGVSGHPIFSHKSLHVSDNDSTASDASSGPAQPSSQPPHLAHRMQECFVMAVPPKRRPDSHLGAAMDCLEMCRPAKLQRQSTGTASDLEDTASSPIRLLNFRESSAEPPRITVYADCYSDAGSLHSGVSHFLRNHKEIDAVKQRFKVLETLVPRVNKKKISKFEKREDSAIHAAHSNKVGEDRKAPCTLHEKRLRLVPFSVEANAM